MAAIWPLSNHRWRSNRDGSEIAFGRWSARRQRDLRPRLATRPGHRRSRWDRGTGERHQHHPEPAARMWPTPARTPHPAPALTAAADPAACARCSSSRGHPAAPAAAHHRGRAAPDGQPRARRVGPRAARDASRGSSSHGPRRGPRPSASPGVARPRCVGPDGRVCVGSGWRSLVARSGRNDARSSSASRRRRHDARSPDRRRAVSEPSTIRQPRAAARGGGARNVRAAARPWLVRRGPGVRSGRGGSRRPRRDRARR